MPVNIQYVIVGGVRTCVSVHGIECHVRQSTLESSLYAAKIGYASVVHELCGNAIIFGRNV